MTAGIIWRRLARAIALSWMLLALAACAGPSRGLLTVTETRAPGASTITILTATTRTPSGGEDLPGSMFSGQRDLSGATHYTLVTLSLPPGRSAGQLPLNAERPDPAKHVTLISAKPLTQAQAMAALGDLTAARAPQDRRALVFTHGFNTQFDEAVFRFAQIVADTGFRGIPVLFSWPSRGESTAYGYDKDSANFSRDAYENLLGMIASQRQIAGLDLFAHSMGNWLTMETLRGVAMSGNTKITGRIGTIVMAAPDIDMEVFRTHVARLGELRRKIILYASSDDYALALSRRLAGGKLRAGESTDVEGFRSLGIEAHDLSGVKGGFGRNHGKTFGDGATISQVGAALASRAAHPNIVTQGFETVGKTISDIGRVVTGQPVAP